LFTSTKATAPWSALDRRLWIAALTPQPPVFLTRRTRMSDAEPWPWLK
jgi:hypothetical protein